jgi:hypothetical protein
VGGALIVEGHSSQRIEAHGNNPARQHDGAVEGAVELDGFRGRLPAGEKSGCDARFVRIADVIVAVEEGCVGGINLHNGIYRRTDGKD